MNTKKWTIGMACLLLVIAGAYVARRSLAQNPPPASSAGPALPETPAQLDAWYVEPPDNAAVIYLQACDALRVGTNMPFFGGGKLPPVGARLPAPLIANVGATVKANGKALELFANATKIDRSRYPVDLALGTDALFPHLPRLKNAAQFLQLAAIWHAEANQASQAGEDVVAALGIARSLEDEPALLSQLIRSGVISTAIAALERTVNRTTLPQKSLDDLFQALKRIQEFDARGRGFTRAMIAERVNALTLLSTPEKLMQTMNAPGTKLSVEDRNEISAWLQKPDRVKEGRRYLEAAMEGLITARAEAFPGRLKADELIGEQAVQASEQKLYAIAVLLGGLAGRAANEAACLAHTRLGLTAVALERYRAGAYKQYPSALSDLVLDCFEAIPLDPFDGQPLRYRRNGTGYVLYSIGPDRKDNSGDRSADLVFAVVAAPAAPALTAARP